MSFGQEFGGFDLGEQGETSSQQQQQPQIQGQQPAAQPHETPVEAIRSLHRAARAGNISKADIAQRLVQLAGAFGHGGAAAQVQQTGAVQQQLAQLAQELTSVRQQLQITQQQLGHVQASTPQTQSSPTPLVPKIKIDLPDKYTGDVAKLRSWCFAVEQYGLIKGLDEKQLAAVSVTLFGGRAKTWWETRVASGSGSWVLGTLTWTDLKQELESVFGDPDRERKLIARFQQFVQKTDVQSYINNFRSLRLELGALISDESALWGFVAGLKQDLKREVLRWNLTTLEDAILAAERADAMDKFARFGVRHTPQQKSKGIVPMEIDNVRTPPRTHQKQKQPMQPRQQRQQQECFYCGKPGHWVKDCWAKARDEKKGGKQPQKRMNTVAVEKPATSLPPPPKNL